MYTVGISESATKTNVAANNYAFGEDGKKADGITAAESSEKNKDGSAKPKTDSVGLAWDKSDKRVILKLSKAENKRLSKLEEAFEQMKALLAQSTQQWEQVKEQNESQNEAAKIKLKCIRIANNIMSGDKVPMKDIQFLQKHEPELYQTAILLARRKDDPEERASELDDDDRKSESTADNISKAFGGDNVSADGVIAAISEAAGE